MSDLRIRGEMVSVGRRSPGSGLRWAVLTLGLFGCLGRRRSGTVIGGTGPLGQGRAGGLGLAGVGYPS